MWACPVSLSLVIIFLWLSTEGHILQDAVLIPNMQILILVNSLWSLTVSFLAELQDIEESPLSLMTWIPIAPCWRAQPLLRPGARYMTPVHRGPTFLLLSWLFLPYLGLKNCYSYVKEFLRLSNHFNPKNHKAKL